MKRLTLIISVFITIAMINTISAAEVNGQIKEIYNETNGTYTSLDNAIPVENATIQIKYNGKIINETKTDKNGQYTIAFTPMTKPVELEISYLNYKKVTYTIHGTCTINHTFMPDIAIISSAPEKAKILASLNNRRIIYHDMWNPSSQANDWILEYVNFAYLDMAMPGTGWGDSWYPYLLRSPANKNYMIAAAFGYPTDTDNDPYGGTGLHLLKGNDTNDTPDTIENTYIASYWALATGTAARENLENMIKYIYYLLNETDYNPVEHGEGPIMSNPDWGLYHPDYGVAGIIPTRDQIKNWIETNPGLTPPYDSLKWIDQNYTSWSNEQRLNLYKEFGKWYNQTKNITGPFIIVIGYSPSPVVDAIIREAEKNGRAAFCLYQGATNPPITSFLEEIITGKALGRDVNAIISLYSWSLNYANLPNGGALQELTILDIPVIKGVQLYDNSSLTNPLGAQYEWTWQVTIPSFEGVFSPIVVSYTDPSTMDEIPIDSGVKKIVNIADKWAKLKEFENNTKKLAIIVYNYPPGKDGLTASYLDVFQSLHDLLIKLKEKGYTTGNIPSPEELYTLLVECGNKGTWAKPLLEQYLSKHRPSLEENGQLISLETYLKWFNELPEKLKEEVIMKWGEPPGEVMTINGTIVIPGIILGNIFIGIQPSRGWEEVQNYHESYLPPHHQYIAFYKWIEKTFKANAMIHLGTHGTLEWLPGRMIGLTEEDWPFQLTNLPNIYPYIVSNPGEGLVAKDRSNALIIDHMTPAMVQGGLYGDLIEIHDLIHQYNNALKVGNLQILPELENGIKTKASKLGFNMSDDFKQALEELHLRLHEIENDIIPLGLHSLGKILSGEELVEEVFTITSSRSDFLENVKRKLYPSIAIGYPEMSNDASYEDEVKNIKETAKEWIRSIINGTIPVGIEANDLEFINDTINKIRANKEWQNLLDALNGGFVEPGLAGDPAWNDVLPTGVNFYAANPKKMPTKAAWETAKKIVDKLLADYYKVHGKFPELVGMVMWGTELLRTDGLAIAEFLYLLGVKPEWNSNGDVKPEPVLMSPSELKIVIDGVEMQRPRVDVFVTAVTGYQGWIDLMNRAVELAVSANDTINYVKRHYDECQSLDRVFGLRGLVLEGTGVSDLLPNTSKWEATSELADVYLSRVSYAWKSTATGISIQQNKGTFQYLLKNMDLMTQNLDSTWRLLDTDDYYDWFGGMLLASRQLGGNPETSLVDIRNKNNIATRSIKEEIELEIRSQLLNPKYMDSLLSSPSGWMEYASRYKNAFAVAVTSNSISEQLWTQMAENLLTPRFGAPGPYGAFAVQSMIGWVLEANRRGIWTPSNSGLVTKLVDKYIEIANQYGVVCCHHTCSNIVFNQWIVSVSSLNSAALQKFVGVFGAVTGVGITVPGQASTGTPGTPGAPGPSPGYTGTTGTGSQVSGRVGTFGTATLGVVAAGAAGSAGSSSGGPGKTGKVFEVSASQSGGSGSQMPFYALLGVIGIVALIGAGYFLKGHGKL
ncbi:cobaltochelatase subunit CobN [Methanothermobacter tenebrarum]|uniref:cobaltochelatase subunit CobN n=1 Tax=Methanothermobacter tenebrarum TaxID=680118 RepID=UPI0015EC6079|nr:cobaltochelatase subunit CobN [Methanothermobacter tenebrarum]